MNMRELQVFLILRLINNLHYLQRMAKELDAKQYEHEERLQALQKQLETHIFNYNLRVRREQTKMRKMQSFDRCKTGWIQDEGDYSNQINGNSYMFKNLRTGFKN